MPSTTNAALLPTPLQGKDLNRFLQQWLVSMVNIDPTLMRPGWQAEPPNLPSVTKAWGAFRVLSSIADNYPAFVHISAPDSDGVDQLQRHERLNILVSFYDLGTDGLANSYAATLRDGLAVAQNREILTLNGMGLIEVGQLQAVPSLLKERWQYRVDLPFQLSRIVVRTYAVLDVESVHGEVLTNDGGKYPINVEQSKEPQK